MAHVAVTRWWARAVGRVLVRPALWPTALVQAGRLAGPGWWRRAPWLPVPDRDYLRFRLRTAYGSEPGALAAADPADLATYLRWCRELPR